MMRAIETLRRNGRFAFRLLLGALPDRIAVRLRPADQRFALADVPPPVKAPDRGVRLYVAPANFAGQGHGIARAAERLPGVGAVNMQQRIAGDYGFPADYDLPANVFASSGNWGRRQRDAVAQGFTHVLVEAERPMFGAAFDGALRREIAWLRSRGLSVALCSHGTDLRLPSRHAQIDEWSPFRDPTLDQTWVRALETRTLRNRQMGESLGLELFVTTPELLLDWPSARWLPIIVESERWRTENELFGGNVLTVLHAPTNPLVKGTKLIEPVLERLAAEGVLDYQRIVKIPASEMPGRFATADVVLDQFAIGSYGTTSIEAMAAGRLVIAHLHDQVRGHIRAITGREVPIVEATPATLEDVLRDIVARPEHYREIARRGPGFAEAVHDGRLSAKVLAPFLGVSGQLAMGST